MHSDNCFVTLTYNNRHLPADHGLHVQHWQLFMKRLRKQQGNGIRFFHCGEYGSKYGRPHYHALLFNFDFEDKREWTTKGDTVLYTSKTLDKLWGMGFCTVGAATFQSAAYVARYLMKKITGDTADEHYEYINPETGEIHQRKPEYITMSRRDGIGYEWFKKYKNDVFPGDFVVIDGHKVRPPRYYDTLLEALDSVEHESVRVQRAAKSKRFRDNQTPERLAVREKVLIGKMKLQTRELEE